MGITRTNTYFGVQNQVLDIYLCESTCPRGTWHHFHSRIDIWGIAGKLSKCNTLTTDWWWWLIHSTDGYNCLITLGCRSLDCGRIKMHKNLFLSLSFNNIFWILWYLCVLYRPEVWSKNPVRLNATGWIKSWLIIFRFGVAFCKWPRPTSCSRLTSGCYAREPIFNYFLPTRGVSSNGSSSP